MAQTSVHVHVRAMAKHNGVPVILHSDHCAKKLCRGSMASPGNVNLHLRSWVTSKSSSQGEVDRVGGSVFFGYGSRQAQEIQTAMDIDKARRGTASQSIGTYKKYYDLCV
ncbi:Aldolase-type TIM barrel [Phytophthora cactorum]|nr:Aldolase-type TIM barrel [Phytophthora cactorum]